MLPVIFSLGNLVISSFGLFLSLGFLYGVFLVWRLARAWDINEEKVLDLVLLVFLGGFLGARFYFVLEHPDFFINDLAKVLLVTKYPGFSFWGGLLGGWISLVVFARRFKLDLWKSADIVAVGFLGGLILGQVGCLLGGCNVGIKSDLFLAVPQVGVLGKRFPIQFAEALFLILILRDVWRKASHFHVHGKIISLSLIYLGIVKLLTLFLKEKNTIELMLSLSLIIIGGAAAYKISKRSLVKDLRLASLSAPQLITSPKARKVILSKIFEFCYNYLSSFFKNQKIQWSWRLKDLDKFLKKIHVKPTSKNIN